MATRSIRDQDTGVNFEVVLRGSNRAPVNLSTATTLEIVFGPPSRASFTRTATMPNGGADGLMRYTLTASDWGAAGSDVGEWKLQGRAVVAGADRASSALPFRVEPRI